jgi:hypothetical protein
MAEDNAAYYRDKARTLRWLAQRVRYTDTRTDLLRLADAFDKLASRLEERETPHRSAD